MTTAQRRDAARDHKVTGPYGERRPMGKHASAVWIMEIATGLTEEEYAPGFGRPEKKPKGVDYLTLVQFHGEADGFQTRDSKAATLGVLP